MKPYTYVLVRDDIPLEQQLVQGCHAALEAGFAFEAPVDTSSLIVCTVPDRASLVEAKERMARYGIRSQMFFEPSWDMGYSALCSEPIFERKKRFAMNKYPLFKPFTEAFGAVANYGKKSMLDGSQRAKGLASAHGDAAAASARIAELTGDPHA